MPAAGQSAKLASAPQPMVLSRRRKMHLLRGTKPVCPQHVRGPSREAHERRATLHPTLRSPTQRGQRRDVPDPSRQDPEGLSQVKRDQNKLERSRSACKDPDLSLMQSKDSGSLVNGAARAACHTSSGHDPLSPCASPAEQQMAQRRPTEAGTPKCTLPFSTKSSSGNRP